MEQQTQQPQQNKTNIQKGRPLYIALGLVIGFLVTLGIFVLIQSKSPTPSVITKDACIITGCSGQICSDKEVITTCEVVPGDECYKSATCERQQNGECGWTQTNGLTQCLQEHRQEDKEQFGDAATKEECLAKAGVWQKWGLAQLEYCQIPAKDAGKSCTDQSQCTYGCISETGIIPGKCATYKNTFGCFSPVKDGKAEQALCVD